MDPTIEDRISRLECMRSDLFEKYFGDPRYEEDLDDVLESIDARIITLRCIQKGCDL